MTYVRLMYDLPMLKIKRQNPKPNPKENKKKRTKKRKKKAFCTSGVAWDVKVFGKKILPLLSIKNKLQIKRVWRFFLQNAF